MAPSPHHLGTAIETGPAPAAQSWPGGDRGPRGAGGAPSPAGLGAGRHPDATLLQPPARTPGLYLLLQTGPAGRPGSGARGGSGKQPLGRGEPSLQAERRRGKDLGRTGGCEHHSQTLRFQRAARASSAGGGEGGKVETRQFSGCLPSRSGHSPGSPCSRFLYEPERTHRRFLFRPCQVQCFA